MGYFSLVIHSIAGTAFELTSGSTYSPAFSVDLHALSTLGSAIVASPLYLLRHNVSFLRFTLFNRVNLTYKIMTSSESRSSTFLYMIFPISAASLLYLQPLTQHLCRSTSIQRSFAFSSGLRFVAAFFLSLWWHQGHVTWLDIVSTLLLFFGKNYSQI